MAKRKTSTRSSTSSPRELQRTLERNQREIIKLLTEHGKLSERLGKANLAAGEPPFDLTEQNKKVAELVAAHTGPLPESCVRAIFRELASGVRGLVKKDQVAYLGPMYSYSHQAAIERFGDSAELVPVATIGAVFKELNRGHVKYGIVPIENSTDGRIVDTLGMFMKLPVRICGEVQIRIHHYLLGKCQRGEVTEVYSKPQALSQCRDWLAKHLPQTRAVEMTSTAAAAQLAADKPGAAAIASRQAGVNYGLNVLAENIEDSKNNVTRFAVIGDEECRRTGRDKTAVMFEIQHMPGSLADVMAIFKRNRINLTWIESFPMPDAANEYLFFVEMQGHQNEAKVKRALAALERKSERLEVLGSYARAEPVE